METQARLKALLCLFLSLSLISNIVFAANLDLPAGERPQIRNRILNCETMLKTTDQIDDSVGIPFSGNSITDFETELSATLTTYGIEKFRNGTFYVLGTPMQDERAVLGQYEDLLKRYELDKVNAKVVVLSAPSNLIKEESVGLARHVLQRLQYFFPSLSRDYQSPQWGEIMSDWQATLAIESVNVYFLFQSMPVEQASLVVATHAIVLNAYTIFTKSLLNFLLRNGSKDQRINNVELFLKQMLLSVPFVLNYSVLGRLNDIVSYYSHWGWQKTVEAFPYEVAHFTATQGLTLALQTIFYSQIITKGYGGWVDRQIGDQNTRDARTLRPLLQVPVLATDAVLLMVASADWQSLLQLGAVDVNAGHVGLVALTASMALIFKKFPDAFQPILKRYQSWKDRQASKRQPAAD